MTPSNINNKAKTWVSYASTGVPAQDNQFTSDVSHELRTPLTSIRGALGLLCGGMLDPNSEKGQRLLEIAINNTERLVHFTTVLENEPIVLLDGEQKSMGDSLIQNYQNTDSSLLIRSIRRGLRRYATRAKLSQMQTLQANENRLRNIISNNADGIVIVNSQGIVQFANPAAESLFQATAEKLTGKLLFGELVAEVDHEMHTCTLHRVGETANTQVRVVQTQVEIISNRKAKAILEMRIVETEWEGKLAFLASLRDITEQKRTEQERDRFFTLSLDMLCICSFDGYFKRLNPAWEKTLGFTQEELFAKPYIEFVHPEDQALTLATVHKLLSGSESISLENRYLCKDGSYKWFLWDAVPYAEDQLIYMIGRDITEAKCLEEKRKQAEEELRKSRERYELAVQGSRDGLWDWDIETNEVYFSHPWKSMLGYAEHEIKPDFSEWETRLHPDDRTLAMATIQTHFDGLTPHYELEHRLLHKDGTYRWILARGLLLRDANGQPSRMAGSHTDITERKQAEWRLGVQHRTTRVLAEATCLREALPKILKVLCQSLGWQLGEFWSVTENDVLRCVETWHQESLEIPEFKAVTQQIIFTRGVSLPGRIWANGTPLWITNLVENDNLVRGTIAQQEGLNTAFGFPIISSRETLGVITFFKQDIQLPDEEVLRMMPAIGSQIGLFIERKRAKEALEESEAQLRMQTVQLKQALQKLKHTQAQLVQSEKMSALGQMVAGVAHEINNPVNFIHGNLSHTNQYTQGLLRLLHLYRKHYPNPVPEIVGVAEQLDLEFIAEDLPKILSSMKSGTDRIREIVLSLRNFSRLDEAQKKPVDIHEGIDSTLLILQHHLKAKAERPAIEVIKEYGDLSPVECYAGQLNQVFMNLLNNAIDAIDEVKEKWQGKNSPFFPQIRIRTEVSELGDIVIRIADNGSGMSEDAKQRLFNPFFTTKPVGKGTGLGLSISYQIIVEKHGGRLQCASELGEGTEFWIQIPGKNKTC